jgi:hypothetical protein
MQIFRNLKNLFGQRLHFSLGGLFYKTFLRPQLLLYRNKLECLTLPFTSTLVQYLQARLEPTRVDHVMGLKWDGRLLAVFANIRLR